MFITEGETGGGDISCEFRSRKKRVCEQTRHVSHGVYTTEVPLEGPFGACHPLGPGVATRTLDDSPAETRSPVTKYPY